MLVAFVFDQLHLVITHGNNSYGLYESDTDFSQEKKVAFSEIGYLPYFQLHNKSNFDYIKYYEKVKSHLDIFYQANYFSLEKHKNYSKRIEVR